MSVVQNKYLFLQDAEQLFL